MTYLIDKGFAYKLSRVLSIIVVLISVAVFMFVALPGFYTWKQGFLDLNGLSVETIAAAVEIFIFLPGGAPLVAVYYFFIFLKKPFYNLVGLLAMFPVVFVHFLFSVPAIHGNVYKAVGLGIVELLLVVCFIGLFNKFVVRRDEEEEALEK